MKTNRYFKTGCLFLAFLVLPCCASTVRLNAVPGPEQLINYDAGKEIVVSHKEYGSAAISVDPLGSTIEKKICLFVGVKNAGTSPAVFGSDNIRVLVEGKPLKVYPYEEMVENIERKRKVATAFAAIGGAMQEVGAYNTASRSYQTGTIYGPGYQANYYGTTYDPAAGMRAQAEVDAQTSRQLNNISESAHQTINSVSRVALKKQTVAPGDVYGGTVFFESVGYRSEKRRLVLEVSWMGETHTFLLDARN